MNEISFVIEKPAIARLAFSSDQRAIVEKALSYKDKSFQYSYEKLKNNKWAAQQDSHKWMQDCADLKSKINQSLLMHDDDGFYTYSGVYSHLKEYLKLYNLEINYSNQVNYPDSKLLPYDLNYTPKQPRYYQTEAVEALLDAHEDEVAHANAAVSLPTGSGKTLVLMKLAKELGLKCMIVAPTKSIASGLLKDFTKAFGKKYVGMFGNTKRHLDKLITIAIGASLVRVEDPEEIKEIQKNQVVLFDESHMLAADTLRKVAVELCGDIPYRYFVSATQMRGDGRDLLLESIIGPIVYSKTYRELVDEGFLADLKVNMILMSSKSDYHSNNAVKMSQKHFLYNPQVLAYAAQLINECQSKGEPTLCLFDEKYQLKMVSDQLKYVFETATADTDVDGAVEKFNDGNCKLLLGTSAIGMGTDLVPVKRLFMLMYGSSETMIMQALGRATRLTEGKTDCKIYCFNVVAGFSAGVNHYKKRRAIYESMGIAPEIYDFRSNN